MPVSLGSVFLDVGINMSTVESQITAIKEAFTAFKPEEIQVKLNTTNLAKQFQDAIRQIAVQQLVVTIPAAAIKAEAQKVKAQIEQQIGTVTVPINISVNGGSVGKKKIEGADEIVAAVKTAMANQIGTIPISVTLKPNLNKAQATAFRQYIQAEFKDQAVTVSVKAKTDVATKRELDSFIANLHIPPVEVEVKFIKPKKTDKSGSDLGIGELPPLPIKVTPTFDDPRAVRTALQAQLDNLSSLNVTVNAKLGLAGIAGTEGQAALKSLQTQIDAAVKLTIPVGIKLSMPGGEGEKSSGDPFGVGALKIPPIPVTLTPSFGDLTAMHKLLQDVLHELPALTVKVNPEMVTAATDAATKTATRKRAPAAAAQDVAAVTEAVAGLQDKLDLKLRLAIAPGELARLQDELDKSRLTVPLYIPNSAFLDLQHMKELIDGLTSQMLLSASALKRTFTELHDLTAETNKTVAPHAAPTRGPTNSETAAMLAELENLRREAASPPKIAVTVEVNKAAFDALLAELKSAAGTPHTLKVDIVGQTGTLTGLSGELAKLAKPIQLDVKPPPPSVYLSIQQLSENLATAAKEAANIGVNLGGAAGKATALPAAAAAIGKFAADIAGLKGTSPEFDAIVASISKLGSAFKNLSAGDETKVVDAMLTLVSAMKEFDRQAAPISKDTMDIATALSKLGSGYKNLSGDALPFIDGMRAAETAATGLAASTLKLSADTTGVIAGINRLGTAFKSLSGDLSGIAPNLATIDKLVASLNALPALSIASTDTIAALAKLGTGMAAINKNVKDLDPSLAMASAAVKLMNLNFTQMDDQVGKTISKLAQLGSALAAIGKNAPNLGAGLTQVNSAVAANNPAATPISPRAAAQTASLAKLGTGVSGIANNAKELPAAAASIDTFITAINGMVGGVPGLLAVAAAMRALGTATSSAARTGATATTAATAATTTAASAWGRFTAGMGAGVGAVTSSLGRVGSAFSGMAHVASTALGPLAGAVSSIFSKMRTDAEKETSSLATHTTNMFQQIRKVGFSIFAGKQLFGLGEEFLNFFTDSEQRVEVWSVNYQHYLGSAAAASSRLVEIQQQAVRTPYPIQDLVNADQQLTAVGIRTERLTNDMIDLAAALKGRVQDPLKQIANSLTQIKGENFGRAFTQLGRLGISRDDLAAAGAEFKGTKFTGTVEEALNAVQKVVEEKFGGLAHAQAKTLDGMITNVKQFGFEAKAYLSEPFINLAEKILKPFADPDTGLLGKASFWHNLISFRDDINEVFMVVQGIAVTAFKGIVSVFENFNTALHTGNANVLIFGAAVTGIIATALSPFSGILGTIAGYMAGFVASFAAITLPLAPFIALAVAVGLIATKTTEGQAGWAKFTASIRDSQSVWDNIVKLFGFVVDAIKLTAYQLSHGDIQGAFANIKLIGEAAFVALVSGFTQVAEKILPSLGQLAGAVGKIFSGLATNAFTWGANLISAFTRGIFDALGAMASALTQAIQNSPLVMFFASHSPPVAGPLKDIHVWGKRLGTEYLNGMNSADFSVLSELTGEIRNHIQSLVDVGEFPKEGLIPRLLGDRTLIGETLANMRMGVITLTQAVGELQAGLAGEGPNIQTLVEAWVHIADLKNKEADLDETIKAKDMEIRDVAKEIKDIDGEIKKQEEDIKDIRSEEKPYKDAISNLNTQLDINKALTDQITVQQQIATSAADERLDQLKNEHDAIQINIDKVNEQYDDQIAGLNETKRLLQDQMRLQRTDERKETRQSDLEIAQLSLADAQAREAEGKRGVDDAGKTKVYTPLQIAQLHRTTLEAKQRLETAQEAVSPLQDQIDSVDSQLTNAEVAKSKALDPLNAAQRKNAEQTTAVNSQRRAILDSYKDELEALGRQSKLLDEQKKFLEADVLLIEQRTIPYQHQIDQLNDQKSVLNDQKTTLDDQKTALQDQKTQLDEQLKTWQEIATEAKGREDAEVQTNSLLKEQADLLAALARQNAKNGLPGVGDVGNEVVDFNKFPAVPPPAAGMTFDPTALQAKIDAMAPALNEQFHTYFTQLGKDAQKWFTETFTSADLWVPIAGGVFGAILGALIPGADIVLVPLGAALGVGLASGLRDYLKQHSFMDLLGEIKDKAVAFVTGNGDKPKPVAAPGSAANPLSATNAGMPYMGPSSAELEAADAARRAQEGRAVLSAALPGDEGVGLGGKALGMRQKGIAAEDEQKRQDDWNAWWLQNNAAEATDQRGVRSGRGANAPDLNIAPGRRYQDPVTGEYTTIDTGPAAPLGAPVPGSVLGPEMDPNYRPPTRTRQGIEALGPNGMVIPLVPTTPFDPTDTSGLSLAERVRRATAGADTAVPGVGGIESRPVAPPDLNVISFTEDVPNSASGMPPEMADKIKAALAKGNYWTAAYMQIYHKEPDKNADKGYDPSKDMGGPQLEKASMSLTKDEAARLQDTEKQFEEKGLPAMRRGGLGGTDQIADIEKVGEAINKLSQPMSIWQHFLDSFGVAKDILGKDLGDIGREFSKLGDEISVNLGPIQDIVAVVLAAVAPEVLPLLATIIGTALKVAIDVIIEPLRIVTGLIGDFGRIVGDVWKLASDIVHGHGGLIVKDLQNLVKDGLEFVKDAFLVLPRFFGTIFGDILSGMGGFVSHIITEISGLVDIGSIIEKIVNPVIDLLSGFVNKIIDAFNFVAQIWGGHVDQWQPSTVKFSSPSLPKHVSAVSQAGNSATGTNQSQGSGPSQSYAAGGMTFGGPQMVLVGEASTKDFPEVIINTNAPDKQRQLALLNFAAAKLAGDPQTMTPPHPGGRAKGWGDIISGTGDLFGNLWDKAGGLSKEVIDHVKNLPKDIKNLASDIIKRGATTVWNETIGRMVKDLPKLPQMGSFHLDQAPGKIIETVKDKAAAAIQQFFGKAKEQHVLGSVGRLMEPGGPITQLFGMTKYAQDGAYGGGPHTGVDFGVPEGTPVLAAADGSVNLAGEYGGYGNAVKLDHGAGLETLYGHMSQILTAVGNMVKQSERIGLSGMTGHADGPHLHFEVRQNGTAVDPMPFFSGMGNVPDAPMANTDQIKEWLAAAEAQSGIGDQSWMQSLLWLVAHESGGITNKENPTPVTLPDGHQEHARGLLQVIPSTFAMEMAKFKRSGSIDDPVDNAMAALGWIMDKWHGISGIPGLGVEPWNGYAVGSPNIVTAGAALLHEGEMVIQPNSADGAGRYIDLGPHTEAMLERAFEFVIAPLQAELHDTFKLTNDYLATMASLLLVLTTIFKQSGAGGSSTYTGGGIGIGGSPVFSTGGTSSSGGIGIGGSGPGTTGGAGGTGIYGVAGSGRLPNMPASVLGLPTPNADGTIPGTPGDSSPPTLNDPGIARAGAQLGSAFAGYVPIYNADGVIVGYVPPPVSYNGRASGGLVPPTGAALGPQAAGIRDPNGRFLALPYRDPGNPSNPYNPYGAGVSDEAIRPQYANDLATKRAAEALDAFNKAMGKLAENAAEDAKSMAKAADWAKTAGTGTQDPGHPQSQQDVSGAAGSRGQYDAFTGTFIAPASGHAGDPAFEAAQAIANSVGGMEAMKAEHDYIAISMHKVVMQFYDEINQALRLHPSASILWDRDMRNAGYLGRQEPSNVNNYYNTYNSPVPLNAREIARIQQRQVTQQQARHLVTTR